MAVSLKKKRAVRGKALCARSRKWTEVELKEFAEVLSDDFAFDLETLALKKSSNDQIFNDIKEQLDARLEKLDNKGTKKKGGNERARIDTSIGKLRKKCKWMKAEWKKLTERVKTGSGKSPVEEPEWYKIMNPIFSETHTKLRVATCGGDIESDSSSEDEELEGVNNSGSTLEEGDEGSALSSSSCTADSGVEKKEAKKVIAKPARRKKKPVSQAQALSELSDSFKSLGNTQQERMELLLKAEEKRERAFLDFQEKQAQLNREHEMRMIHMMAMLQQLRPPYSNAQPQPLYNNTGYHFPEAAATYPSSPTGCYPDTVHQDAKHYTEL